MNFGLRQNTNTLDHNRNHSPGQQTTQSIDEIPVGILLKLPQQPGIQLFLVQGGLQIQTNRIPFPVESSEMSGCAENHRARQAKMGKQQLPLILIDHFSLFIFYLDAGILQSQTLHLWTAGII